MGNPTPDPERSALAWLDRPDASSHLDFWAVVAAAGTPLIAPDPDDEDARRVTLVWRSTEPLDGVYARLNRVTDKDRVAAGLMSQVPGTDVWSVTLILPADLRVSYRLTPIPAGSDDQVLAELGGRTPGLTGRPDPWNAERVPAAGDGYESVLALPRAPEQPEWRWSAESDAQARTGPGGGAQVGVDWSTEPVAGRRRPLRHYLPDPATVSGPVGLLVVTDAERWFPLGLAGALADLHATGEVGPFAVLGVDNLDVADRIAVLGGRSALVRDLADRLVPEFRAAHPEISWAGPQQTVLCGQSLGALTGLVAALEAPEVFGSVLAHSPSMWWRPEGGATPSGLTADGESWITERFRSAPVGSTAIRLAVGRLEGVSVPQVQRLHDLLTERGWAVDLDFYTGGHDFACWRGELSRGLRSLSALATSDSPGRPDQSVATRTRRPAVSVLS